MKPLKLAAGAFAGFVACAAPAHAWQPSKPIEFVVTSSPGGGTDNFTRMIQSIITKYKLIEQPIVVVNKGGGSGAEGYLTAKTAGRRSAQGHLRNQQRLSAAVRGEARLQVRRPDAGGRLGTRRIPAVGQGRRAVQDQQGLPGGGEGQA